MEYYLSFNLTCYSQREHDPWELQCCTVDVRPDIAGTYFPTKEAAIDAGEKVAKTYRAKAQFRYCNDITI